MTSNQASNHGIAFYFLGFDIPQINMLEQFKVGKRRKIDLQINSAGGFDKVKGTWALQYVQIK